MKKPQGPKILLIDIETSPLEVYTWGIHDQNVGLNQIIKDWSILSCSLKWLDENKIMYMDTKKKKDPRDDKDLVKWICQYLNQADVVVSHYGSKFDVPKIDTRRLKHNLPLFAMPKHEDTKTMANKFSFTSNKLEYIAKYLDVKNKKLVTERKFQGMELWKACLAGNKAGWKEMELYNKKDVFALEDIYKKLRPRASKLDINVYNEGTSHVCSCGSHSFHRNGFGYTSTGKFQRFTCTSCGKEHRSKVNLLSKEKRASLKMPHR